MFIKTVKLKRSAAAVFMLVIIAAVVLIIGMCVVKASGAQRVYKIKTEQQRQALIDELGWETDEKPIEHKSVTLPKEFDDVYDGYNELQKQQGFDLEKFKGKKVEIYYYPVYNYEGHSDCIQLTLMGYEGELIGGDICCTELDGFMQGIMKAKAETKNAESKEIEKDK